jgi:hypothetical protein
LFVNSDVTLSLFEKKAEEFFKIFNLKNKEKITQAILSFQK